MTEAQVSQAVEAFGQVSPMARAAFATLVAERIIQRLLERMIQRPPDGIQVLVWS